MAHSQSPARPSVSIQSMLMSDNQSSSQTHPGFLASSPPKPNETSAPTDFPRLSSRPQSTVYHPSMHPSQPVPQPWGNGSSSQRLPLPPLEHHHPQYTQHPYQAPSYQFQHPQQPQKKNTSPRLETLQPPVHPRPLYWLPAHGMQEPDHLQTPSPMLPNSSIPASKPSHGAVSTHSPDYSFPSPASAESDNRPSTPPPEPRKGRAASSMKRPPMRSSIACVPCRRSKIKCDNDGEGKVICDTCLKARRDCHYPSTGTSWMYTQRAEPDPELQFISAAASGIGKSPASSLKRDGSSLSAEGSATDRKRLRRSDDSLRLAQISGAVIANEILSAPYFTETMWTELFEIFKLNFATELPFLHMPTLKEQLGDMLQDRQQSRPDGTNLVLLGVLALTSRFHANLVKYISYSIASRDGARMRGNSTKSDPTGTSEHFADALVRALGPLQANMATVSVERVQAFLMLGLYEWTLSTKKDGGLMAWMYVGGAVRMAQALGMCDEEQPSRPPPQETARATSSWSHANGDEAVRREIRRRTMFSCFVLDRMLSCGKGRVAAIRSKDLHIQLPCSGFSFDLGEEVQTGRLKPALGAATCDTDSASVSGTSVRESLLAHYVTLVDIWGEISRYSFSGGRLAEKRPPWEDSEFRRLRNALENFYAALPSPFRLSMSNYHKHESHQESITFVSLHMLGAVCQIMLHREYVPFIPIRCHRPMGPLDPPTLPTDSAPAGFWDESAQQMFSAARDIVALIEACMARRKVPMSALTVFSVWTAAFVGIYANHFPQMDTMNYMTGSNKGKDVAAASRAESADESGGGAGGAGAVSATGSTGRGQEEITRPRTHEGPTGTAYNVLRTMARWLPTAADYVKCFQDMDLYYEDVKKDFQEHVRRHGDQPAATGGIRQGGPGGGLEEWKVLGMRIANNGSFVPGEQDSMKEADEPASGSGSGPSAPAPAPARTPDLGRATDSRGTRGQWLAPAGGNVQAAAGMSVAAFDTGSGRALGRPEVIVVEDDSDVRASAAGRAAALPLPPWAGGAHQPHAPSTPTSSLQGQQTQAPGLMGMGLGYATAIDVEQYVDRGQAAQVSQPGPAGEMWALAAVAYANQPGTFTAMLE